MIRIDSPCIRVCTLDPVTRLCRGCGRTIDEIAQWRDLDDAARQRVMAALPQRLAQLRRVAAPADGQD